MIRKVNSVLVSECVFNIFDLNWGSNLQEKHITAYLDTFNNCRETGYYACFGDDYSVEKDEYKKDLFVWVFENRNSDDIVVITSTKFPSKGMFDEDSYRNRKYFKYNECFQAAEYIAKTVIEHFLSY